jgi:hypothetical protein
MITATLLSLESAASLARPAARTFAGVDFIT